MFKGLCRLNLGFLYFLNTWVMMLLSLIMTRCSSGKWDCTVQVTNCIKASFWSNFLIPQADEAVFQSALSSSSFSLIQFKERKKENYKNLSGIHISGHQVIQDNHNIIQTSMTTHCPTKFEFFYKILLYVTDAWNMNFLDTFSHLGVPTSCKMWHYFDKVLQPEKKWKKI